MVGRNNGRMPFINSLCMLMAFFFLMFVVLSFLQLFIFKGAIDDRTKYLLTSSLQAILVFILPPVFCCFMEKQNPVSCLGFDKRETYENVIGIIIVLILGFPALNQIIYWNNSISFPEAFKGVEQTLRGWEEQSDGIAEILLSGTSVWNLLSGILAIGVLTGIAEETFFRAGMQRVFAGVMNHHAAIWIAALIFSVMHMQFFGFFPRLLLGALFGYLYFWTRSIWVPATAHALNNSIVVLTSWLNRNGYCNIDFDSLAVAMNGFPFGFLLSCIMMYVFFKVFRRKFFPKNDFNSKFELK